MYPVGTAMITMAPLTAPIYHSRIIMPKKFTLFEDVRIYSTSTYCLPEILAEGFLNRNNPSKAFRLIASAFINAFGMNNNVEIHASVQIPEKRTK